LFPDKGCLEKWRGKVKQCGLTFSTSRLIEDSSLPDGSDLADYLPEYASIPEAVSCFPIPREEETGNEPKPTAETLSDGRTTELPPAGSPLIGSRP
jgi:hypothetical protein